MRFVLALLTLLQPMVSFEQTKDWWSNMVRWDGNTPWWKYQTTSPGFYGPNAFTIPSINNGDPDSVNWIETTGNLHISQGDFTQNLAISCNFSTKDHSISFDALFIHTSISACHIRSK
jgi:hypothetical protein